MLIKGIRISDGEDILSVKIIDILNLISNKNNLNWMILFLNGMPNPGKGLYLSEYRYKINQKNGTFINLEDLLLLSDIFFQIYEMVLIGDQNVNRLHRYDSDEEMYELCEIVIELIDCAFWEVHTKDLALINLIENNFKKIELLF